MYIILLTMNDDGIDGIDGIDIFIGMYINPAFFEQQGGGAGNNA